MTNLVDIRDRIAAGYVLDLLDPSSSLEAVEEALAWTSGLPENRHASERAKQFLELCDRLPTQPGDMLEDVLPARTAPRLVRLAAILVFAIMSSGMLVRSGLAPQTSPRTVAAPPSGVFGEEHASRIGQQRTIVLPDGSSILLAPASRVVVNYDDRQRGVRLVSGEAIFQVAKEASRPFTVTSGRGVIVAHGTEFDVKRDSDGLIVTLVHGLVNVRASLKPSDPSAMLRPGMQIRLVNDGRLSRPHFVDVARVTSWRKNILNYDDVTLGKIVADLNRYSKARVVIADPSLQSLSVSGSVQADSLDTWLDGLAGAFDIEADRTAPGTILLKPRVGDAAR